MAAPIASPVLDATLRRIAERARRRRRNATLVRAAWAGALAAAIVAGWHVWDRLEDTPALPLAGAAGLVAATALLVGAARWFAGDAMDEAHAAREVDRRLGLDDRTSSALAVARGGSPTRLAAFVLRDAEETLRSAAPRVEAAFPEAPPSASWRPLRLVAYVAAALIALAVFLDFVWVGVRGGIWSGRPAPGGEPSEEAPPVADAPRRPGDAPGPGTEKPKPSPPDAKREDEKTKPATGDVHVAIRPSKEEFESEEPVTVEVSAAPTGELAGPRTYDLRIDVDGREVDTGVELTVDPREPIGSRAEVDLRKVPGVKLPAGEHEVRARLTTRTSHEAHPSEPAKFRIRPPKDDGGKDKGDGKKPDQPKPERKPQEPPPPRKQPGEPKPDEKQPAPPQGALPPPPALDRHVVVPLFGEGDEVKKKGLVLVLDPTGGSGGPPARRPLDDVLTDARRRAEDLVDTSRVPESDRDLVHRYFELLEALRR